MDSATRVPIMDNGVKFNSCHILFMQRGWVYIYIYIYPFSIATTLRFRGGHYSCPWIAPLTLDPYLIILSVKQGGIQYYFLSLWYDSTWD